MSNKLLFYHNTASEYRIPLFQELSKKYDVMFIFTRIELSKKIYGNDIDEKKMEKIRHKKLTIGVKGFIEIYKDIKNMAVEAVVIPTMDTTIESIYAYWIFVLAKLRGKKTFYYWEKWEAPLKRQPIKKKIKNTIQRIISKVLFTKVDHCFSMGEKAKEYFSQNGVDIKNVTVTYNTSAMQICECEDIREKYSIPKDHNIILYFGRIIQKKGLDILIKAFASLPSEISQKSWLLIVGSGDFENECRNLSDSLNIKKITWVGYVHPDFRYNYFSQCDIFVLPTYHWEGSVEGWGLTINEAIQCGKIVIGTTAVGSAYDLINDNNGCIVEENNVISLKNGLIIVSKLGFAKSAYSEDMNILKLYNYERSAQQFIKIFEQFLTKE